MAPYSPSAPSQPSVESTLLIDLISDLIEAYIQDSSVSKRIEIEVAWQKQGRREILEQRLGADPEIGRQILGRCTQNLQFYVGTEKWNRHRKVVQDRNGCRELNCMPFSNTHVEMIHVGLVVRLVQLFIGAGQKTTSPSNEGNYFNMAGNLLQVINRQVCSAVKCHDTPESCVSRPPHNDDKIGQLTQFTMHLFIQVINPICGSYPMLLPHTWRGFCEITSLLQKTDRLDENCLVLAINCLVKYLREGVDNLINTLLRSGETDQIQVSKHIKILIFFAARLAALLPILLHEKRNTLESIDSDYLGMIFVLLKLRGISLIVPALPNMIDSTLNKDDVKILSKQVTQLSLKAGQCLDGMILGGTNTTASSSNPHLKTLITMKLRQASHSPHLSKSVQHQAKEIYFLSESALCLGKFQVLLSIVSKFLSSSQLTTGDAPLPILPVINPESALTICEELLYRTLPACHFCINLAPCRLPWNEQETEPLTLLSQAISKIVCCVIKYERLKREGCKTSRTTQIHRLLARWLCPIHDGRSNSFDTPLHPLSQEIILAVVQIYIVRSAFRERSNAKDDSSRKFLFLLAKLFFDPRTMTMHRENIGILLHRLLFSSNKVHQDTSHILMETVKTYTELALCKVLKSSSANKNGIIQDKQDRKRRRCVIRMKSAFETLKYWTLTDLHAIAPLMEMLSFRDMFWHEMDMRVKEQIFSSWRFADSDQKLGGSACIALLLHTGSIAASKKSQQITNEKMVEVVLTAFAKMCKSIDTSLINGDISASLLRFLFVAFAVFRCPLSQQNLQLLSDVLRCCLHHVKGPKTNLYVAAIFSQIAHVSSMTPHNHELLSMISSYFHSKLSSGNIGIVAVMMSAIENFASTLPAKHRRILPSCVPTQSQGLLQSRLKGGTFSFLLGTACSIERHKQFEWGWIDSETLMKCTSVTNTFRIRRLYHTSSDVLIESGSKIIAVHSENNSSVSAIIVIPPSKEFQTMESIMNATFGLGKAQLMGSLTEVALTSHGFGCSLKIQNMNGDKADCTRNR